VNIKISVGCLITILVAIITINLEIKINKHARDLIKKHALILAKLSDIIILWADIKQWNIGQFAASMKSKCQAS